MRNPGLAARALSELPLRTSPVHHITAIDVDRLPGDVPPPRRCEEDGHGGDVLGLLPAVQGNELLDFVGRPLLV
jgi:hypothetical protein